MVVVKGAGMTYFIGNGRQVEWEEVPEAFKQKLKEQKEITECVELRAKAQKCIENKGFWDPDCVELTETFHLCQANALRRDIAPRRFDGENA